MTGRREGEEGRGQKSVSGASPQPSPRPLHKLAPARQQPKIKSALSPTLGHRLASPSRSEPNRAASFPTRGVFLLFDRIVPLRGCRAGTPGDGARARSPLACMCSDDTNYYRSPCTVRSFDPTPCLSGTHRQLTSRLPALTPRLSPRLLHALSLSMRFDEPDLGLGWALFYHSVFRRRGRPTHAMRPSRTVRFSLFTAYAIASAGAPPGVPPASRRGEFLLPSTPVTYTPWVAQSPIGRRGERV